MNTGTPWRGGYDPMCPCTPECKERHAGCQATCQREAYLAFVKRKEERYAEADRRREMRDASFAQAKAFIRRAREKQRLGKRLK